MSFQVGENVGAYRIVEQLGQGGMATVFKAYHAALDRYVAIKVLHPAFKEDPNFLARFQREARVVAKLEHLNIVPVYDFAEHGGSPYLVMKFIEGETLKARLGRGPLPVADGLKIIESVGAGLDFAHKQGILHRDIKPSNVMLAKDGGIFLADFGLARIALAGESTLSTDSMLGTPHYMSPEQAKGVKDLDAGTDIYSMGVVIYELVVGRVPFSADTPFAIIHDHIYAPLPMPRSINENVPESVERVLLKALAKERADRHTDVAQLVAAFREAVQPMLAAAPVQMATALPDTISVPTPPGAGATAVAAGVPTQVSGTPAAALAAAQSAPALGAPEAVTRVGAAGPVTQISPASAASQAAPAAAAGGYRFQWWHPVVALVVVAALIGGGLFALRRGRQARTGGAEVATKTAWNAAQTQAALTSAHAQATNAAQAHQATATAVVPLQNPPDVQLDLLFDNARRALEGGDTAKGLELLDQAAAKANNSPEALLRAGDLALAFGLAEESLSKYYFPARTAVAGGTDDLARAVLRQTALAMYALADKPGAEQFLARLAEKFNPPEVAQVAQARWLAFNGKPDRAREILYQVSSSNGLASAVELVRGDLEALTGQWSEARRSYQMVFQLGEGPSPGWAVTEAKCRFDRLVAGEQPAKLEATCEPLPLLVGLPPSAATGLVGNLTLLHAYGSEGAEGRALNQVLDTLRLQNPGLTVNAEEVPFNTAFDEWTRRIGQKGGPDLLVYHNDNLGDWARAGQVAALDAELADHLGAFWPLAVKGVTFDGKIYAVPGTLKAVALFYNRASVTAPPQTTEELLQLVRSGRKIAVPQTAYYAFGFFTGFGGTLLDSSGRCIADQGGFAEATAYLLALKLAGATFSEDVGALNDQFRNGQVDMIVDGPWMLADYRRSLGDSLGVAPLPSGPAGPARPITGVDGWYVNPNLPPERRALAVKLALAMQSVEGQTIFVDVAGAPPSRPDVPVNDPLVATFAHVAAAGLPRPLGPELANYWTPFGGMLSDVLSGAAEPEAAVRDACQKMNELNGK